MHDWSPVLLPIVVLGRVAEILWNPGVARNGPASYLKGEAMCLFAEGYANPSPSYCEGQLDP